MSNKSQNLKRAFIEADIKDFSELLCIEWEPSNEFEQKISKIINNLSNPFWKYVNTSVKRTAVIIITLFVLLGSSLSIKAIREPVLEWILKSFGKYSTIDFEQPDSSKIKYTVEEVYKPQYIPAEFMLTETKHDLLTYEEVYTDQSGNIIRFSQQPITTTIGINTEQNQLKEISISGYKGYLCVSNGGNAVIWSNGEYVFTINFWNMEYIDEITLIAENVSLAQ